MQVEEKRACPSCGGDNPTSAGYCWRCYAPLGPAAPTAAPVAGPASFRLPPPPVAYAPTQQPEGSSSRGPSTITRIVVGVVAAMVGMYGARMLLDRGPSLPDTLNGVPRMTSQNAKDFEKQMIDEGKKYDLKLAAAAYSAGATPEFIVLLISGSAVETTDQLFDEFVQGMASSGASVDSTNSDTGTRDGTDYRCVPVSSSSVQAAACMWRDPGNVGIVLKLNADVSETRDLLFTTHDAVT